MVRVSAIVMLLAAAVMTASSLLLTLSCELSALWAVAGTQQDSVSVGIVMSGCGNNNRCNSGSGSLETNFAI